MVNFIDIPTEQTTAATDVILALVALCVGIFTFKAGKDSKPKKGRIWTWAFGLLAFAALTGAVAHGFQMSPRLNYILWQPLNLALGLALSMFVVGVTYDLTRGNLPKFVLPVLLATGTLFYLVTIIIPGIFLVFILYEALAMVFSLVIYMILGFRNQLRGAWFMALGILVTIIAAAVQASESVSFSIIWDFDHNGIFHMIQIIGLLIIYGALREDLKRGRVVKTNTFTPTS